MANFTLDESFLFREYSNSAFKMYKILNAYKANKEKGIRVTKEYFKSKEAFIKAMEIFQKKYENAYDYLAALNELASTFDTEVKKEKCYITRENIKRNSAEKNNIIKKIYDSGLSMLDYLFYNLSPLGLTTYFNERCSRNDKIALEINKRKDKTYPIIIEIINLINNGEIDYVGYYEKTKLNPYYLSNIAKENNIYTDSLAAFIRSLRTNNQINVERELSGTLVINEEEIPNEVKIQAIEYLNSINAPMDVVVYNNMVRRLVKKSSK